MKHQIQVQSDARWKDHEPRLILCAQRAIEHQSAETGALSIVLTDSSKLRDLNATFAGEDHATDVLSFYDGSEDPESGQLYYGDVIIAVDLAEKQAEKAGHPLHTELSLLTVHGVLHLLGHDHANQNEKQRMWSAQEEILDSLNLQLGRGKNNNE
jgi:probable rRNA maturation factor